MTERYRLAAAAEADLSAILRESGIQFGPIQRRRYAELIETAAGLLADDPRRPGSRARRELGSDVRSFHVELAARRRGAAAHQIYYVDAGAMTGVSVVILRILHERMDPALHIASDLG